VKVSESTPFSADQVWDALEPAAVWPGEWRRFRARDQVRLLNQFVEQGGGRLAMEEIGRSPEGSPLHTLRLGKPGGRRVLMWARQHGDEPECTAALNTVLWKLVREPGWAVGAAILDACEILVFPMVNPDGTDRYTRACANGVDLNRDARVLVTPEGTLLAGLQKSFRPEFGFNLHDMNPRKTTKTGKPDVVAIAFQSCPFNEKDEDSPARLRSKAVIAEMLDAVRTRTPHVARYAADFMARGFGDGMASWGVGSILVESGSRPPGEVSEEFVIRLHALAIVAGLHAIATGADERADPAAYDTIPYDEGRFDFDQLLRGGRVFDAATKLCIPADIGWCTELQDYRSHDDRQFASQVAGVGDLYAEWAREERDATGLVALPGGIAIACERSFDDPAAAMPFLRAGITTVVASAGPFRDNRQRREFVEGAMASPIALNVMTFELVLSAGEVLRRHGMTPLAGFHVPGLHIKTSELREFARRWHPALREALDDADGEGVFGLDLFYRGAGSPMDSRLVLCLHPAEEEFADRRAGFMDAAGLNPLAEAFLSTSRQVFAVAPFGGVDATLDGVAVRCLIRENETPPADYFARLAKSGDPATALSLATHGIAEALRIPGVGLLRPRRQADVVAVADAVLRGEGAGVAPAFVAINGDPVIADGEVRKSFASGRWIFA